MFHWAELKENVNGAYIDTHQLFAFQLGCWLLDNMVSKLAITSARGGFCHCRWNPLNSLNIRHSWRHVLANANSETETWKDVKRTCTIFMKAIPLPLSLTRFLSGGIVTLLFNQGFIEKNHCESIYIIWMEHVLCFYSLNTCTYKRKARAGSSRVFWFHKALIRLETSNKISHLAFLSPSKD